MKKPAAAASLVLALFAIGCGVPKDDDDEPASCSASVRQVICPVGFPADQRICMDQSGAPVTGCLLPSGITCVAACQRP